MKQYDIFFISYKEKNAEANWNKLVSRFPYAKRIKNITGIFNAYNKAANSSETDYFYVIDADNIILDTFNFDFQPTNEYIGTYIWKAENSVNNLKYGYGGVKLYRKKAFKNINKNTNSDENPTDFMSNYDFPVTTKISFVDNIASLTKFNSSEFDAWKASFRECCKLVSFGNYLKLTTEQKKEDFERLQIWTSVGNDQPFGNWVIKGAIDGKNFGLANSNDIQKLSKINDFNWLKITFKKKYNYVFP